jgi:hypothetical protein
MFLPIAQRWGGGPSAGERMVEGYWRRVSDPSTVLRMVPLPTGFAGRDELL